MTLVVGCVAAAWFLALSLTVFGTYLALNQLKSIGGEMLSPSALPAVSILKPLKGADSGLYKNLKSFFELDYPRFELLFSVDSKDDPAVHIVDTLMAEYPHVTASLLNI